MSNQASTPDSCRVADTDPLMVELAKVLPKGCKFTAHHLSTPPTITDPLCHPPAYNPITDSKTPENRDVAQSKKRPSKPLITYCEKHFLIISIDSKKEGPDSDTNAQVMVLGIEIYIYTTSFSTIIFVAKADSTGYLNLLNLPKGTPSPIREITACFLAFLVTNRRRATKQLVVNLFARSQSQYLFAGSVDNSGKHILDDRGLVKWWCRVLNSLLEDDEYLEVRKFWDNIHGYLIIPGLDNYETRAFLPRSSAAATNWTLGHPLEKMSPYTKDHTKFGQTIHPRSLIPVFPDDPKARFIQELEESVSEKAKLLGGWKTPRTLDQFWDMMAFRQECSSGRLTGFVWVLFEPRAKAQPGSSAAGFIAPSAKKARRKPKPKKKKKSMTGPIIPRKPQIKTHQRAHFPKQVETPYYYWPENGRGRVVLSDTNYKRAIELLLHLEFATLDKAVASTTRWTKQVDMGEDWSLEIIGKRETIPIRTLSSPSAVVNNLGAQVRRKRGPDDNLTSDTAASTPSVNTLGESLIRKKAKVDTNPTPEIRTQEPGPTQPDAKQEPTVNVLGGGLVRKKESTS
ncbi:histone acetylation protein-domain-containing protein [Hypoxylon fragiforme]|uniref:histone acetylation protein-domain-containing protein n=1 Tax=Hypoxylon fragiforme TaxID=63214 RepID=UPI0020C614D4|nr:histone acetylation protein-domain-containing protein [Hypoxylon fragiforme]KAI2608709.1 histone acetylation protein-domain-containing protein [Hypoxylon fragiforme]